MNEVAKTVKPMPPLIQFKRNLKAMKDAGDLDMLPSNISYEAFRNAAIVAYQENAQIMLCKPDTIFKALRKLAAAGLVPDGREAALVPFHTKDGKVCTALPMVYGMLKVARNSGEVSSIWAEVVFEGEELRVWIESGERRFDHTYDPLKRGGTITGAYAVAKMKDGTIEFQAMSRDEIERRRKASANQKVWENGKPKGVSDTPLGIWADWYEEMAKKTVLHNLCKRLPLSSDDQRRVLTAAMQDEPEIRDVTPKDTGPRKTLAQAIQQPDGDQTPLDGEVMPDEEPDQPEYDENDVDPFSDAYTAGQKAFKKGEAVDNNPYNGNPEYSSFIGGWIFEQEQAG